MSPMITSFLTAFVAPLALQASTSQVPRQITSLDQLPIEEATPLRCAVAFGVVGRWQTDGDPRGQNYPDMKNAGGREFFVRSVATLMEARDMSREEVTTLVLSEARTLNSSTGTERIKSMMPACLLMKQAAGL